LLQSLHAQAKEHLALFVRALGQYVVLQTALRSRTGKVAQCIFHLSAQAMAVYGPFLMGTALDGKRRRRQTGGLSEQPSYQYPPTGYSTLGLPDPGPQAQTSIGTCPGRKYPMDFLPYTCSPRGCPQNAKHQTDLSHRGPV